MDRGVGVIAVTVDRSAVAAQRWRRRRPPAVAVGVGIERRLSRRVRVVIIGDTVAVFVDVVRIAHLGRPWIDRRVGVVAVARDGRGDDPRWVAAQLPGIGARAIAVAVGIGVKERPSSRAWVGIVGETVAVFVDAVRIAHLGRPGIDRRVVVVAVDCRVVTVAVGVHGRACGGEIARDDDEPENE